jgi:hypothetical protein
MSAPDTTESQVQVARPDRGALELTVHALHGIFRAMDMLGNQRVADKVAHEGDRRNGIANLIVAGERLCDGLSPAEPATRLQGRT